MRRVSAATPKRDHGRLRKERTGSHSGEVVEPESIPSLQVPKRNEIKKGRGWGRRPFSVSSPFNLISMQCPVPGEIHGAEIVVFFWRWNTSGESWLAIVGGPSRWGVADL